jgi:hypothetical protein
MPSRDRRAGGAPRHAAQLEFALSRITTPAGVSASATPAKSYLRALCEARPPICRSEERSAGPEESACDEGTRNPHLTCHPEEQSDEGSVLASAASKSRSVLSCTESRALFARARCSSLR